ncbi:MAG: hypothetical protein K8S21_13615 [Gemmatimonadetes bacterium]|nr:hypothetical protein [Gemmatimonadota bacterium]
MRRPLLPLVLACLVVACEDPASPSGSCLGPQVFKPDTTVSGVAFTDDCTAPDGFFGDVYQFTVAAQTDVLLTMTSTGFDGALALFSGIFTGGTAPRLIGKQFGRGAFSFKAFLPAGTYFVVAGSDEAAGGDYTLTSAPTTTTPCTESIPWFTTRGADITGLLTTADCVGAPGAYQDIFGLEMQSGEQIAVSAELNKVGFVLWRRDGSASAANLNQFSALTPNVTAQGTFTAPDQARFNVHVNSDNLAGGTLAYTLHIR